jgi:phage/plasmid-like protein (TIGR03299 family)
MMYVPAHHRAATTEGATTMSHNLDQSADGTRAAFMSDREPAWHRLGTSDVGAVTVDEAMKIAHLDGWEVTKSPMFTADHDGAPIVVPNRVATIRRNPWFPGEGEEPTNVLGVVSTDYKVWQNETAFGLLTTVIDDADATVSTAGALDGGRKAFLTLRLPDTMKVAGEDPVDLYLAGITSHDASLALTLMLTPVRVVCQNTATYALGTAPFSHRIIHTGDDTQDQQIERIRESLALSFAYGDAWVAAMDRLVEQSFTDAQFDRLVRNVVLDPLDDDAPAGVITRHEAKVADLTALFTEAETNAFGRGTKYGALNAIGEWAEWVRPTNPTTGAKAALFGPAADVRQKALVALTAAK